MPIMFFKTMENHLLIAVSKVCHHRSTKADVLKILASACVFFSAASVCYFWDKRIRLGKHYVKSQIVYVLYTLHEFLRFKVTKYISMGRKSAIFYLHYTKITNMQL